MSKWFLGITGGIGSGKTTVANYFKEKGIDTIDADQAARWVVQQGKPALTKITDHFGNRILLPDGCLDRPALRELIFNNPIERQWLEQLLHPLIRQEIIEFLAQAQSPYAILVSPLLIESKQAQLVNRILVVDVPESLQIARSLLRDQVSKTQIKAIMNSQLARAERLTYADDILLNDQPLPILTKQIDKLHHYYLSLCQR